MFLKGIFAVFIAVILSGCGTSVKEVKNVKSYKTLKKYSSLSLFAGNNSGDIDSKFLNSFEDILFKNLYDEKNKHNFVPGDQLTLKYEIKNVIKMKKHLADFGTYFGKDNSQFEVLFTILDKYGKEIGMYHIDIDVEYWLFPSDEFVINNAMNTASYVISKYLKANYLVK